MKSIIIINAEGASDDAIIEAKKYVGTFDPYKATMKELKNRMKLTMEAQNVRMIIFDGVTWGYGGEGCGATETILKLYGFNIDTISRYESEFTISK